jgi:CheY-like chemotaxis protein
MGMARILIVDDDEAIRRLVRLNLTDLYEVFDTGQPEEALALALEHKPDAILLDLRMPGYSGFELCKTLTSFSATQLIPVFVISGSRARGMGGDAVSAVWICVYGNDWTLGVAVRLLSDSQLSGSAFIRGILNEGDVASRRSRIFVAAALQQAKRLSGQLGVQVSGVPVLPAFGEPPVFDTHD